MHAPGLGRLHRSRSVLRLIDFVNPQDFLGARRLSRPAFAAARHTARLKARLTARGVQAISVRIRHARCLDQGHTATKEDSAMYRDLNCTRDAALEQELQVALVGTILKLDHAARRYAQHRRRHGYDYGCRRLLDEFCLSRSLLFALADEVRTAKWARGAQPQRRLV